MRNKEKPRTAGFKEGYQGSTQAEVDHLQGNVLTLAILTFDSNSAEERQNRKTKFIDRLERAKQLPEYGSTTTAVISKIIQMAEETDWNSQSALRALSNEVSSLTR